MKLKNEEIERAAEEYETKVFLMRDEVSYADVRLTFLAGAEYIVNNTQKDA